MSDTNDKRARIVAARMALRARFEERMQRTPSVSDTSARGTGPLNRHGMPQLPIGQTETKKWPVLDLGAQPDVSRETWTLTIDGACDAPYSLTFADLMQLEQVHDVSDFHCVTTWSRLDIPWHGVRLSDVLALATPHDSAVAVMCHAYDGYTTNLLLDEALKPDVLLVHQADGRPLPAEHGGPVRVITPQLYAWKGAKWVRRLELMTDNMPGFWEERGYSMTAYPWRDDRYG